jgi:hypothetical protein
MFHRVVVAWRGGKLVEFFNRQELAAGFLFLYAFDFGGHVDCQVVIDKHLSQRSFENEELGCGGVVRYCAVFVTATGVSHQEHSKIFGKAAVYFVERYYFISSKLITH